MGCPEVSDCECRLFEAPQFVAVCCTECLVWRVKLQGPRNRLQRGLLQHYVYITTLRVSGFSSHQECGCVCWSPAWAVLPLPPTRAHFPLCCCSWASSQDTPTPPSPGQVHTPGKAYVPQPEMEIRGGGPVWALEW